MSATLSCFGGKDSFQVVAVYPSGRRFAIGGADGTLAEALVHLAEHQRRGALDWAYEVDVTYTGSDGCRHWRGNVGREQPCLCPDDCNCRHPWRTNYCGCKAHRREA